jgi:hypothetical protein
MLYVTTRTRFYQFFLKIYGCLSLILLTACSLGNFPGGGDSLSPESTPEFPLDLAPTPTIDTVYTWTDENIIMSGVCFEAANDAAGRTFIIRNEAELTLLYDLADNSRLCRRPVERGTFDFTNGRVLAGIWSAGRGCTARHDVLAVQRDDAARVIAVTLRFVTEGDCPYELVRPFWVGLLGATDYQIALNVVP